MQLIKREYLDTLIRVKGTPDVKVITGIRRSGKSNILKLFLEHIRASEPDANIIEINYSLTEFTSLNTQPALEAYVEEHYVDGVKNYLLIDEVQMCDGFEKAINNFYEQEKFSIYITGSNAFLLSSDLATLFTGRSFEIEIFPFSYKEFLKYHGMSNTLDNFDRYVQEGGMAGAYLYDNEEDRYKYIQSVYKALIIRDIKKKHNIKDELLIERVTDFLINNTSKETSVLKITNTLKSKKVEASDKTIANYISYLCDAYLFYKVRRYDINGRNYLSHNNKYYLADPIFKYALQGTKNMDYGLTYENIVAIELLRRGYELYTGELYDNREIDFVAKKKDELIYIQVSDNIDDPKTFDRETKPLLSIRDAYPKIVIARTRHEEYQYEGIRIIDIGEFLSGEKASAADIAA